MGTNYYAKIKHCPFCGRNEKLHLGKSSFGWKFLFQANNFEHYHSWQEMKEWLKDQRIENEYDDVVELGWFIDLVEEKHKNPKSLDHGANSEQNIPIGFVILDDEGYEFHNGDFS